MIASCTTFTVIRKRFPEEQIALLLELKWWDWEIEKITRNVAVLTGNDIQKLQKLAE